MLTSMQTKNITLIHTCEQQVVYHTKKIFFHELDLQILVGWILVFWFLVTFVKPVLMD